MASPTLIYCAGGNKNFSEIARKAGFLLGAQLPDTVYYPIYFADQNWKNPSREIYMREVEKFRPVMASVIDWEMPEQLPEVLSWAEEIAQFVQIVMIIPKVQGGIAQLPRKVAGKVIRLGYSVPTKHGGTMLPVWDFLGWPVHLLGGSPHAQMELTKYLDVVSVDGNMSCKMATERCSFWSRQKGPKGHWINIRDADGKVWEGNGPLEAFRRSCANIAAAWKSYKA